MLANARDTGDGWIRDPADPDRPLDLATITDPQQLAGAPAAVSTTKLVANTYTNVIWHFRIQSIGGLALLWAVMAARLRPARRRPGSRREPIPRQGALDDRADGRRLSERRPSAALRQSLRAASVCAVSSVPR